MAKHPIPAAALDDRLGFVGTAGSGKTYNSMACVERLLEKKARVVVVDPLGVWWGLRLKADGKQASPYDVAIFGGDRGDLPLTEHAGALVGETVAGIKESAIVDLSQFGTKAAERRFMLAFLTALYRHANGEPVHVVFDEADMWAPQRLLDKDGEAAKLLGAMETFVRRGRIKGFIPWLITQRPAVLSKNVLSQIDGLVAFKLTSSQDRDAIGDWVQGQADAQTWKELWGNLPTMQRGQGLVWVPGRDVLDTVQFPEKKTFDSSRTPKRGERTKAKTLPPLDVGKLQERLASVEKEVKANDPKALKAALAKADQRIAQLVRESGRVSAQDNAEALRAAEQRGFERGAAETRTAIYKSADRLAREIGSAAAKALKHCNAATAQMQFAIAALESIGSPRVADQLQQVRESGQVQAVPLPAPQAEAAARPPYAGDVSLSAVQGKILDATVELEAMCGQPPPRLLVAIQVGYGSVKSTGFAKALSGLSAAGLTVYPDVRRVAVTELGRQYANIPDELTSTEAIQRRASELMGPTAGKMLAELVSVYPDIMEREELARRCNYQNVKSTGFAKSLSRLSSVGLVNYPSSGTARASEILFPERAS